MTHDPHVIDQRLDESRLIEVQELVALGSLLGGGAVAPARSAPEWRLQWPLRPHRPQPPFSRNHAGRNPDPSYLPPCLRLASLCQMSFLSVPKCVFSGCSGGMTVRERAAPPARSSIEPLLHGEDPDRAVLRHVRIFAGEDQVHVVCIFAGSTPQPDWTAMYYVPSTSNDTGTVKPNGHQTASRWPMITRSVKRSFEGCG
jgi:hypothetical protein